MGNTMAGRYHGCFDGVSCNTQSKEETGERERKRIRCQGPARGRTLMMMMMMIDTLYNMRPTLKVLQIIVTLTAI